MHIYMAADPKFKSEKTTFQEILNALSSLSNDYHCALNVTMPKEYDMLICSPVSIIVVEVKAWTTARPVKDAGMSAGDDYFHAAYWIHDNLAGDVQPNPILAVRDKTNALQSYLAREKLKTKLPCYPILIFPNMSDPPKGLVFPDGFGKVFFKQDLKDRLPEFISSVKFSNANSAKYPTAQNYRLTATDIREKIIPTAFVEKTLRDKMLETSPGSGFVANLFQFAGPVTGDRFYGMEKPMTSIKSRLGGHFFIAGMRRMGKTSLMKRAEELRWDDVDPYRNCDFLFLDFFSDITDDDARNIYENILMQMYSKLRIEGLKELGLGPADKELRIRLRKFLRFPGEMGFEMDIHGTREVFREIFQAILKSYHEREPGRRAVMVFDEFSDIYIRCYRPDESDDAPTQSGSSTRISKRDLRFLMSLMKDPAVASACSIVIIGKPYMIELDRQMKTEIFSVIPQVPVDFLTRQEMRTLILSIGRPVKCDENALAAVWQLTAGHPFYVQLLCNVAMSKVQAAETTLTLEDFGKAAREVLEDDSKFTFEFTDYDQVTFDDGNRDLVKLATAKVVACLSHEGLSGMTESDLIKMCRNHMHLDERAVERVLRGLTLAHVLERRQVKGQTVVLFKVPLVHGWCRHRKLFEECKRFA